MFGRKNVMQQVVSNLEARLIKQADQIAEDHEAIVELKSQHRHITDMVEALCTKIDALKARQDQLREGLFNTLTHDQKDNND